MGFSNIRRNIDNKYSSGYKRRYIFTYILQRFKKVHILNTGSILLLILFVKKYNYENSLAEEDISTTKILKTR